MELYFCDFKNLRSRSTLMAVEIRNCVQNQEQIGETLFCRAVDDNWDFGALPQVCRYFILPLEPIRLTKPL
ncbi:hypothetical protein RchiOBHm_Chr6g0288711 [Rosa chinensis]|uniref:Uncharacterized protein n=1 Tax=Rosa chinensis TaxID=74649 RepID=A0A2P6PVF1_ROSCH|nr:hypothetical protein RchiOBHm_Chr6g0288711 [Rosa chinensis]